MRSARTVRVLNSVALTAVAVTVVSVLSAAAVREGRSLVVWSCGGNYEFLSEYAHRFESRSGTPVSYTAAPVQYLLELALRGPDRPDVIVGRAGPGWVALDRAGVLAASPTFFAIDPIVIAVSPQSEGRIVKLEDLGATGVRVAASTGAMRPKAKVIGLFMASVDDSESPGLVERWQNNTAEDARCGRFALEPLLAGTADAAIVPRSITTHQRTKGRVGIVPIPSRLILGMQSGRSSMPQCAAALATARRLDLARGFVDGLLSDEAQALLADRGYIAVTSPEAVPYEPMLALSVPRDAVGLQVRLAQLLRDSGATPQAVRRYWSALCLFGPSAHDGRILTELGDLLWAEGRHEQAAAVWQRAAAELPRPEPNEFAGGSAELNEPIEGVDLLGDREWAARASCRLAVNGLATRSRTTWLEPTESDPPKDGKRHLALADSLMAAGYPELAVKDYLKVCTLNYPSYYMPQAEAGVTEASEALECRAAPATLEMPLWQWRYDTHWARGMTLGMRLFDHRQYLASFKEMLKLCAGEYGEREDTAEARYRAGVAALALGGRRAAARQWTICGLLHGESPWAAAASRGLAALPDGCRDAVGDLPSEDRPGDSPAQVRLLIAEELFLSGLTASDETLLEYLKMLTVAAPRGGGAGPTAQATCRVGECLLARGNLSGADEYLRATCERWPDSPWAGRARSLRTESGGEGPCSE